MNHILSIEEYLKRPYHMTIMRDVDGGYSGILRDFPRISHHAETASEVANCLLEKMRSYLELNIKNGVEIPEPHPFRFNRNYHVNGRWTYEDLNCVGDWLASVGGPVDQKK